MAARYCDNCGQPVLRTDTTCWHCGVKLAPSSSEEAPPTTTQDVTLSQRSPNAPLYAALTAVVAVALLLVTASLGRRPLLLQGISGGAADWVALRDGDGSYSIRLPAGWSWLQATNRANQTDLAERIAAGQQLQVGLDPIAQALDDVDIMLLADDGDSFLILGRSIRLADVPITDLLAALHAESFPTTTISHISAITNEAGQAAALLAVIQKDPALECRQLILPAAAQGYLAATCTPAGQMGEQEALFMTMLTSLQIRD
jgi:hypothetical protein